MRCRICDENSWDRVVVTRDVRFATTPGEYEIERCRVCGVMATRAGGELVDPAGHYPAEYAAFAAPAAAALARARATRHRAPLLSRVALHRFAWLGDLPDSRPLRVLEVGCASGKVALALMAARGWTAVGIEPDAGAAEAARKQGLETHTGTLDDYTGAGDFDAVLFVHVLEHLPDPLASLRRARSLLAPGGHVVVAGTLERAGLIAGPVRHEWYSLVARSVGNRWRSRLPYAERRRGLPFGVLESVWGFALAACRSSSAIQVVARAR
jgi:SAM-dependent methyltransferase